MQMPCRDTVDYSLYTSNQKSHAWRASQVPDSSHVWLETLFLPAEEGECLGAALHAGAIPKQDGVWWDKHSPAWLIILWRTVGRQCWAFQRDPLITFSSSIMTLKAATVPLNMPRLTRASHHALQWSYSWSLPRAAREHKRDIIALLWASLRGQA